MTKNEKELMGFIDTIVWYPHWLKDEEKCKMLVNMAKRLKSEVDGQGLVPPLDTASQ